MFLGLDPGRLHPYLSRYDRRFWKLTQQSLTFVEGSAAVIRPSGRCSDPSRAHPDFFAVFEDRRR